MALHAAGVSIDKVVRDTKSRQEAIDTYQGEQRKLFGASGSEGGRKSSDTG
jgi:hypothetical protein